MKLGGISHKIAVSIVKSGSKPRRKIIQADLPSSPRMEATTKYQLKTFRRKVFYGSLTIKGDLFKTRESNIPVGSLSARPSIR